MAKLSALLLVAALTAGSSFAQSPPKTPEDVARDFERHFNAGDLNSLEKLYSKGGVFVPAPGVQLAEPAQVRGGLQQYLAFKAPINISVRHVYRAGDIALIVSDWTLDAKDKDGKPMPLKGSGADVVARQADGTWLYLIDNPNGVAQAQT